MVDGVTVFFLRVLVRALVTNTVPKIAFSPGIDMLFDIMEMTTCY